MWYSLDSWIVVIGILCAIACALPGCFLVLRRMSMMGDAISHAVLPGLAIAYILTESRSNIFMFVGAAAMGLLTALLTQAIARAGKVENGAAMGIVFTSLFALGLILISGGAARVDLDPNCVLFGAIELTPLDVIFDLQIAGLWLEIPRAFLVLSAVLFFNGLLIFLFYKELKIGTFDPAMARTLGKRPELMHALVMVMVAITAVAAFELVGSILVIALLIVPAATAQLITRRLGPLLFVSAVVGSVGVVAGHLGAITLPLLVGFEDTSTSGMIAVALGVIFFTTALWSARAKIFSRRPVTQSLTSAS
jgi:manganese/zinc/iron transport system permease protein